MRMEGETIFDKYLEGQTKRIFKNDRHTLRPEFIPSRLPHRDEEIGQLAAILSTALKGERPSNILIYGKTGTGKTACARYIGKELRRKVELDERAKKVNYLYLNCKVVDTDYGILAAIGNNFIRDEKEKIPFTGWPMEKVYNHAKERIEDAKGVTIIILDEIDQQVYKSGGNILYLLTNLNDELMAAKVSIIGISNDSKFTDHLEMRIKTRLGEEKVVFSPYNAEELKDILFQRSDLAFEKDALDTSVIPLCSALAAQEHGDARRALDLLRVSGELAERECANIVAERHVYKAKNKIELDVLNEVIRSLPMQSKILLMGIIVGNEAENTTHLTTGEVYDLYKELCRVSRITPLTQRRITDLISELDMLGIITATLKSFGRGGGRTRLIKISVSPVETKSILAEDDELRGIVDYSARQTKLF